MGERGRRGVEREKLEAARGQLQLDHRPVVGAPVARRGP
jgi:hypothetical protein